MWTNQFDNTANARAHYETTGPEIWQQTEGKVDAVVLGTGTGGTLSGVGRFLKEKNAKIKVFLADPQGSVLYNWYEHGELKRTDGSSITEGIGQGRVTDNMKEAFVDKAFAIQDTDAVRNTFRLLCEEGFLCGASTGLNITGAMLAAKELPKGSKIVTVLCDNGQRYFNKLFSRKVLVERGLLESVKEEQRMVLH